MKDPAKIGILGGSFDPPHLGHLIIAELAREQLGLDTVVFVPAFAPPHKKGNHVATAQDRLAMTKLAVRGNPHFQVSDLEVRRKGISYTIDTLRAFRHQHPSSKLFLIIGEDSLRQFWTWKLPREILSLATLAVYARPGYRRNSRFARRTIVGIHGPLLHISSTGLRKRIARGESILYMVPDRVRAFIIRQKLYRR